MIQDNIYAIPLPKGVQYLFNLFSRYDIYLNASEAANIADMFITEVALSHTSLKAVNESVASILSSRSLSTLVVKSDDNTIQSLLIATRDALNEFSLDDQFTTSDIVISVSGDRIILKRQG